MKGKNLTTVLIAVILALLFLWLRENEMRVAAESKLSNLQYKATSTINEKGEAIADLSTQVGEMQAHLQQATEESNEAITDRDAQIAKLNEDARIASAEHEAALAALEADMKKNTEKYDAALKKKNTELSGIGEELRKTTERLAAALKEKEQVESKNYDIQYELSALRRRAEKLNADNKRLEALSKIYEQAPPGDQKPA